MGNTLVIFKVSADPDNLESVENKLKEVTSGKFQESKREPIAFGIEVIKVGFVIPDKTDGAMPALEEEVQGIEGVESAEVVTVTLI
jgi:translation elongation factor aEF-1 beta